MKGHRAPCGLPIADDTNRSSLSVGQLIPCTLVEPREYRGLAAFQCQAIYEWMERSLGKID